MFRSCNGCCINYFEIKIRLELLINNRLVITTTTTTAEITATAATTATATTVTVTATILQLV
jgi:hypothetical protein